MLVSRVCVLEVNVRSVCVLLVSLLLVESACAVRFPRSWENVLYCKSVIVSVV